MYSIALNCQHCVFFFVVAKGSCDCWMICKRKGMRKKLFDLGGKVGLASIQLFPNEHSKRGKCHKT